jgi:CBS domain-containing protein
MSFCVKDIMVREVLTINSTETVKNAARLMSKFGVSSLIVTTDDDIVGIITERDILTRVVSSNQDPNKIIIKEIMTESLFSVNPETSLNEAIKIMFRERIKKLPVISQENNRMKLVGILSIIDIAKIQHQIHDELELLLDSATDFVENDFYIR